MSIDKGRVLAAARIAGRQAAKDHAAGARVSAPHVLAGSLLQRQAASEWHRGFAEASPAVVKLSRVTDLNGEVTWRDSRDDDEGGYAAGGGGMTPRPHAADGTQYVPGGVPGSTAGGEPSRWDGGEPEPRVASAPDDADDAAWPNARGVPPRPGGHWPAAYMDGYWPQGGHGTGQAGTSSPGGGLRGRPPNAVGKGASDYSDPSPVDAEHVKSLMLANFPASALSWVDEARWIGPVEVPQDRIDTDDEDSWAASGQPKAVKRFAKAIKDGTGHTHPVILVQSPGNPRAVVIDGHHRTLAYRKLGRPVKAYVGQVEQVTPEMLETHSYQQHQGADPANKRATLPKDAVNYREASDPARRCGTCVMYRDHACTLVRGDIDPGSVCDRWEPRNAQKSAKETVAAGLAVRAADTGRVLMLQRAITEDDPAAGMWEFPGGGLEPGEAPLQAALREWGEETGCQPPRGRLTGRWEASNGVYEGFVLEVPSEQDVPVFEGRDAVWNPDDPDGDMTEALAWWSPELLKANPAVRQELAADLPVVLAALGEDTSKAADGDHHGNAERLREYWAHGEGAAKIAWGSPGDFDRCVLHVGKFMDDPKGYCAERHHDALGIWPATHAAMERGKEAAPEAVKGEG